MGFAEAFPVTCINKLPSPVCTSKRKLCVSIAKLSRDNDPLLLSATASASLRYSESLRPEPLFLYPYAGCFVPDNTPEDVIQDVHPYCLVAKFIDDKLLHTVSLIDGIKQLRSLKMLGLRCPKVAHCVIFHWNHLTWSRLCNLRATVVVDQAYGSCRDFQ
ncbi:uncharacterized protein LOC114180438 isoform X2 [Vigna unguiculata]|uniref:uncharacterized protein LOC114180438 isoform X2 n=1 Tax=Vigna unguiculata TaxID=3917 RepID=UPI0010169996|nr:uncharacterized protein LOC114180438 isoform X2 [Vigna unguiculata]